MPIKIYLFIDLFYKKRNVMKIKALLFALVLFGLGACTQRTCPTYAKSDVNSLEQNIEQTEKERV